MDHAYRYQLVAIITIVECIFCLRAVQVFSSPETNGGYPWIKIKNFSSEKQRQAYMKDFIRLHAVFCFGNTLTTFQHLISINFTL